MMLKDAMNASTYYFIDFLLLLCIQYCSEVLSAFKWEIKKNAGDRIKLDKRICKRIKITTEKRCCSLFFN